MYHIIFSVHKNSWASIYYLTVNMFYISKRFNQNLRFFNEYYSVDFSTNVPMFIMILLKQRLVVTTAV